MFSTGRSRLLLVVGVVVIAAVGFGGWYFFIRDDAPPRASVEAATGGSDSGSCDADLAADDIQGTWNVDNSSGSVDEGTGTFAGYRIEEELANVGTSSTAAGRTDNVSGDITVDGEQVTEATFEVDMASLQSDESRRDDRLRTQGLQTDQFPTSTFTLTEPIDIPSDAEACEEITFTAVGDLDLHGVTQTATVNLNASLNGDQIVLAGSAPIVLADYAIEPPVGGFILSIEDSGELEFQIILTPEGGSGGSGGGSGEDTESTDSSDTTEATTETTLDGY